MPPPSLKYAHVERERRWLLAAPPDGLVDLAGDVVTIADRYITGSRLRLREVCSADGMSVRKLGHKVRLGDGPEKIACTTLYLDDREWNLLGSLEANVLTKKRHRAQVEGGHLAIDVFTGHCAGLVLVELDRGDGVEQGLPASVEPVAEVTHDERFTGAALASCSREAVLGAVESYGIGLKSS